MRYKILLYYFAADFNLMLKKATKTKESSVRKNPIPSQLFELMFFY